MRKAVLLGLVVVLALAALAVAGCGGSSTDATAVAAVQASLTKINTAIADLTAKGIGGTLTIAQVKAARDSMKPEVQSIVDNGKNIKGADVSALQKAWTDLDAAITGLSDSAPVADALGVLMNKATPLQKALADIGALVTPTT